MHLLGNMLLVACAHCTQTFSTAKIFEIYQEYGNRTMGKSFYAKIFEIYQEYGYRIMGKSLKSIQKGLTKLILISVESNNNAINNI